MLRSTSFGLSPLALGVSAAVHAVLLIGPAERAPPQELTTVQTVDFDVLALAPPTACSADPVAPVPRDRPTNRLAPARSSQLPPGQDRPPLEDGALRVLARSTPAAVDAPAPVAAVHTTSDEMPRFTISMGPPSDARAAVAPPSTSRTGDGSAAPLADSAVDGRARLVHGVAPVYPGTAREDGIEGDVDMELVVDVGGAVQSARLVRGLGHGLDEAALRAAYQFRFAPATKGGLPVRVRMPWSMQFRLQ